MESRDDELVICLPPEVDQDAELAEDALACVSGGGTTPFLVAVPAELLQGLLATVVVGGAGAGVAHALTPAPATPTQQAAAG